MSQGTKSHAHRMMETSIAMNMTLETRPYGRWYGWYCDPYPFAPLYPLLTVDAGAEGA